jgi:hypothetical protein
MHIGTLFDFGNLFLAGIEIGIHYGVGAPPKILSEKSQLQLRQAMSFKLRVLVPVFFVLTTLSAIAVTVLHGASPGFWFRCVGLLAALTWIILRVVGTVPINKDSHAWDVEAPPKDWRSRIERAEMFHIYGTWAATAIFALFLAAMAVETGALR